MYDREPQGDIFGAEDLVELFGFPTRGQLRQEGLELGEDLYKKLMVRLARNYLAPLMLELAEAPGDMFQLRPATGNDWKDAAWWLGHTYNLHVDRPVVGGPEDLLTLNLEPGQAPYPSLRRAVLANLWLLREVPKHYFAAGAGATLRKAVGDALEVLKVRSAA